MPYIEQDVSPIFIYLAEKDLVGRQFATVRTYVIHLLGTYVAILCNWLIF